MHSQALSQPSCSQEAVAPGVSGPGSLGEEQQPHLFPPDFCVAGSIQKGRFLSLFPHPPQEDNSHMSRNPQAAAASHPCGVSGFSWLIPLCNGFLIEKQHYFFSLFYNNFYKKLTGSTTTIQKCSNCFSNSSAQQSFPPCRRQLG